MQAHKEIQVPAEKVKEVYEKFYSELKELEQAAKDKEQQIWEEWVKFEQKESNLRREYCEISGSRYLRSHPNPYLGLLLKSSPVSSFLLTCNRMLEGSKHSTGAVTMTQEQVSDFEFIQSGKAIEQVKEYISTPIEQRESYYQRLIDELKSKPVAPSNQVIKQDPEEDDGTFVGAILGVILLFTLVCVMIKSCS